MRKYALLLLPLWFGLPAFAQESKPLETGALVTSAISVPSISANSTPKELASAALAAQGGEKFKNLKSMWLTGGVDLLGPNSLQSIPGKFSLVSVGDKVRIDINAPPLASFKQISDGERSYSSLPGVELPPASKFGLPVLTRFDQPGYTVSALPDKKKLRGFRIADAEGNTTDYYIDPATDRVVQFLISYNGFIFGTENTKFRELEGVLIPMNFTQRLETPQGVFSAEYKVKDVRLNQPVGDDVFAIQ